MKRLGLGVFIATIFFSCCYSMDGKPKAKTMEHDSIAQPQKAESRYFFHQQINDMCMIAPMLNLKLLELTKNEDGTYDFEKLFAYSRREWIALNMPYLLKWHGIIESLNHPWGKEKYPDLINFVEAAKKYGPVFPHFYDKKGNSLISNGIGDVFSGTLQAPYLLIDFDGVKRFKFTVFGWPSFSMGDLGPGLGLFLPVFKEKNKNYFQIPSVTGVYPYQKVDFEPFQLSYTNNLPDLSMFTDERYQSVNTLTDLLVEKANFLGFDQVLKTKGTARGYLGSAIEYQLRLERSELQQSLKDAVKQSEFLTFALGLYKLMLLSLGITEYPVTYADFIINEQEQTLIAEQEKNIQQIVSNAVINIHDYVEQDPQNPWHSTYFSKEIFLQHAIAEILKENKDLYDEAKVVNDFYFPVWGTYNKYLGLMAQGECFNAANERYYANLAKYFLPSEEYVMAYGLTQNAWYLAIGAINSAAFYKALTNDTGYFRGMMVGTLWSLFKNRAYEIKNLPETDIFLSYMDVWKKIATKVCEKYGRKNWISFSGHGLIISFDEQLIGKQRAIGNEDAVLFNDLGFTIIDSWLATELNTFYKK